MIIVIQLTCDSLNAEIMSDLSIIFSNDNVFFIFTKLSSI